ncbi:hypothetical protein CV103_11040 [Sphingomonas fennica]|uniref:Uncharacterized protein n=1 Tax=Edaphosphingomonas fennica TaxID=114404 RepID=A0A2T4HYT1_9SPHN|nr:hypothetical protein CV103_11040 [Sphingomonas fennica]
MHAGSIPARASKILSGDSANKRDPAQPLTDAPTTPKVERFPATTDPVAVDARLRAVSHRYALRGRAGQAPVDA